MGFSSFKGVKIIVKLPSVIKAIKKKHVPTAIPKAIQLKIQEINNMPDPIIFPVLFFCAIHFSTPK